MMKKEGSHLIGTLVLAVIGVLASGFSVMFLWQWYATPLGLPELTFVHAMGVAYLVRLLTYTMPTYSSTKEDKPWWYSSTVCAATDLVFLFVGWVWHFYM